MGKGLVKYGVYYTFSNSLQKGIGFFVFMFLANQLSTQEYATFGLNYSLFTIMMTFSAVGIYPAIVGLLKDYRDKDEKKELLKAGNSVFLLLSIITFLGVFCITPFLNNQFDSVYQYIFFAFSAITLGYFTYQSNIVRLNEEHWTSIIFSFVPYALSYLIGFALVTFYSKEQSSYFLGVFISIIVSIALLFPTLKNKMKFSNDRQKISIILRNIIPYIVLGILAWLSGYGNTYVIDYFFEDIDVATFVFLFTLSSILQLLGTSLNQVWAPKFYNDFSKYSIEKLEEAYTVFTIVQAVVLGSAGLFIIWLSNFSFDFLDGWKKFQNREVEIMLLFLGYIISISWWHHQNYFMVNNKGKILMGVVGVSSFVGYVLWIFCMFFFGQIGIYIGYLIHIFIRSLFVFVKARQFWSVKSNWQAIVLGILITSISLLLS